MAKKNEKQEVEENAEEIPVVAEAIEAEPAPVETKKAEPAKEPKAHKGNKKFLAAGNILHGKKLYKKGDEFPHLDAMLLKQGAIVEA